MQIISIRFSAYINGWGNISLEINNSMQIIKSFTYKIYLNL